MQPCHWRVCCILCQGGQSWKSLPGKRIFLIWPGRKLHAWMSLIYSLKGNYKSYFISCSDFIAQRMLCKHWWHVSQLRVTSTRFDALEISSSVTLGDEGGETPAGVTGGKAPHHSALLMLLLILKDWLWQSYFFILPHAQNQLWVHAALRLQTWSGEFHF